MEQQLKRPAEWVEWDDYNATKKTCTAQGATLQACCVYVPGLTLPCVFHVEGDFMQSITELWKDYNEEQDKIMDFANGLVKAAYRAINHLFLEIFFELSGVKGEAVIMPKNLNQAIYEMVRVPKKEFKEGVEKHGLRIIKAYRSGFLAAFIQGVAAEAIDLDWTNEPESDIDRCSEGDEIDKEKVEALLRFYIDMD
jgi:hypothetical protein